MPGLFIQKPDLLPWEKWRRGWDSNPRYGFPYARFRGEYFQPLSHLSAVVTDPIVAERRVFRQSGSRHYANALGSTDLIPCNASGGRRHCENREVNRLKHALVAARSEERLDDGGAVSGEDARCNFHLMIEARVGEDFEAGAHSAALGIVGAVNEARDACLDDGARAHAAGFDGDIERGTSEAVVAKKAGGFAQSDDFGVGGGVAIADGAVARAGENLAVMHKNGPDGDLTGGGCGTSFGQGFLHELDLGFHLPREDNMFHGSLYQPSVQWQDSGES